MTGNGHVSADFGNGVFREYCSSMADNVRNSAKVVPLEDRVLSRDVRASRSAPLKLKFNLKY